MGISRSDTGSRTRHSGWRRPRECAVEQPRPMPNQIWSAMKTTTLGRSGLHVSRIAFGTWQLGLDPRLFLEAIADGPLASDYAMTKGAAMLDAEFTPGFPLRHATKDVELALSAAHRHGVELPLTDASLPRWHQAIAADHGDDDVAAVVTAAATATSPPGSRLIVGAT